MILEPPPQPEASHAVSTRMPPLVRGSPFPGLRSFTPRDAAIFFGRGRETDALLARVAQSRFVGVPGASGSGKSSLVGAGLVPRLAAGALPGSDRWLLPGFDPESKQWTGLRFTPGEGGPDPFLSVAARLAPLVGEPTGKIAFELATSPPESVKWTRRALQRADAEVALIFVDQLEELFTIVAEKHVAPFVAMLEELVSDDSARVVVTVRADLYARCVELPALARLFELGSLPLAAPSGTLLEMITGPAERAGLSFEEGLVGRLLGDTGSEAGALPLLAFALEELYRARSDRGVLQASAYEALGGVAGAIGTRADQVYAERLDDTTRARFPSVFRDLVELDDDGRPARRRAPLSTWAADAAGARLIEVLADARLLVRGAGADGEPVVFVAHEALFTSWSRLSEWIATVRDDLRLLRRVTTAAGEWRERGFDDSYLWPHERLAPVYEMVKRLSPLLDDAVLRFIRPEAERLLPILEDPGTESYRRQATADRLAVIGAPALPALIDCLWSESPAVRNAAAAALGRVGVPALPGVLEVVRTSGSADVRLAATAVLRQVGGPDTVDALLEVLRDDDSRIRSLAAGALEALGGEEVAAGLAAELQEPEAEVRWRAAGTLGAFGPLAVPALLDSLRDPEPRVASTARDALNAIGADGVEPLVEALHDADAGRRAEAAEILCAAGPRVTEPLLPLLGDDDADLRWRVAEVFAVTGDSRAGPALRHVFSDDDDVAVRIAAAAALGAMAGQMSVEALVAGLTDEDDVAAAAAAALARIGAPAVDALTAILRDSIGQVERALAAAALGTIGAPAASALLDTLDGGDFHARGWAADALISLGVDALPSLVARLWSSAGCRSRGTIAELIARLGPVAENDVLELAHAEDPETRRAVVHALTRYPRKRVRPILETMLGEDDLRADAAAALAALGPDGLPALFGAIADPSEPVRAVAAEALAAVGGEAVPGLLERLNGHDAGARAAAAAALRRIGTPMATLRLFALQPSQ